MSKEADWPSFSIVVPTYRRREIIRVSGAAIAAIDYPGKVELIVVIDGSDDGTGEALEGISFPFVRTILWQDNAGAASARNAGAREATGDIILFLDDDMRPEPDILRRHAESHCAGFDAVLGDIPLDPASPAGMLPTLVASWARLRSDELASGRPLRVTDFLTGHLSVERRVFEQLKGFDTHFTSGGAYGYEDTEFGIRLIEQFRVTFNPRAVARQYYAIEPGQNLRQYYQMGQAAVDCARKHPALARAIFPVQGTRHAMAVLAMRALAGVAPVVAAISAATLGLARAHDRIGALPAKVARRLYLWGREVVFWAGVHDRGGLPRSGKVLILCYHALADLGGCGALSNYGLTPQQFAGNLDDLRRRGFRFVSPDEVAALLAGVGRVPRKAVLVTFDDCYVELAEHLPAIMQPRGVPGVAFAVSGMATGTNEWDIANGMPALALCDAQGLKALERAGIEIGCHSRTHRRMSAIPAGELHGETAGARETLAGLGLARPRFFAYPFGAHDAESRAAVRRAGFRAAFTVRRGHARASFDPMRVPRVEILARDKGWRFRWKTGFPLASGLASLAAELLANPVQGARRVLRYARRRLHGPAG